MRNLALALPLGSLIASALYARTDVAMSLACAAVAAMLVVALIFDRKEVI